MKICCTLPTNIEVATPAPDMVIKTCKVCNSKQYELTLDPGMIGVVTT